MDSLRVARSGVFLWRWRRGVRWSVAAVVWLVVAAQPLVRAGDDIPSLHPRLAEYRLAADAPRDPGLQTALEEIDRRIGSELDIAPRQRACGVLDLTSLRLAMVRGDALFYGASVPKICILLAYFHRLAETREALPAAVRRELELMIKRSSNELAAKYSQLVGLELIQELQTSERYGFYDRKSGGGLWSGKHYGIAAPRTTEPIGGFSHSATVRQCLRYYLLLEQGRLVDPATSRRMRDIFEAPELDFHDDNFVAGLRGRDVTLIRKNGRWEDWHLDTARVRHGDRVYLIAGMAHHARGGEYLRSLARQVDELLCRSGEDARSRNVLVEHATRDDFAAGAALGGRVPEGRPRVWLERLESLPVEDGSGASAAETATYLSPVVAGGWFNEVLVSWNLDVSPGAAATVELRVGRRADDSWSPFLYVGDWGGSLPRSLQVTEFDGGKIDVDYFVSQRRFDRCQYRVRAYRLDNRSEKSTGRAPGEISLKRGVGVRRVTLCLSDRTGLPLTTRAVRGDRLPSEEAASPPERLWKRRLPVPFRSQKTERPEIAGRICSPTSVSMVLEYRGVRRETLEVAESIYDRTHDIYGNWPRAVQAAYERGVPGYLRRFSRWSEVERAIARGQPLIASIAVKKGQLAGAPYDATAGHLIVLTGFDAGGNVLVNDPAAASAASGQLAYRRSDLDTVWLARGGTAYVLLSREEGE